MIDRISCVKCGASILRTTAERTDGLCMPCKGGFRKNIEESKVRYEEDKKYRESVEHKHWLWLIDQVHKTESGFAGLSHPNKLYFSANLVSGEVYNGGFDQYFFNSSGDYFNYAIEGLKEIGAVESLQLLLSASRVLFGDGQVPSDTTERRLLLSSQASDRTTEALEILDQIFYTDPDGFAELMTKFAQTHFLHSDF